MMAVGLIFAAGILSGCTKSFCSVEDNACLYATYVTANQATIDKNAKSGNYIMPGDKFWSYIDTRVTAAYTEAKANPSAEKWIPAAYIESNVKYQTATEEEKKSLVNDDTVKAIIRYGGYNSSGKQELWANFGTWISEANSLDAYVDVKPYTPTAAYLSFYKSAVSSGVGRTLTCISPVNGYFGINNDTFVSGKTWKQAFDEYGFIEGLLVYPVGWLIYTFAMAFGTTGGGQILSIFLVTLIVRALIVVASIGSNSSQTKMADIQPELALIQAKYPNADTNQYEKQKMTQETMGLYKKSGIHPFRQILVLLVQFPVFIAVWGALEGSAILTSGSVLNLYLSTVTYKAVIAMNAETPFAIVLFLLMAISQFFASMLPTWIQKWHKNRAVGAKTVKVNEDSTSGQMMKYMPIIMMVVVIVMGLTLPAAMGIYWFFGALISIFQTIIMEVIQDFRKNRKPRNKDKYNKYKKLGKKDDKHMNLR
jgi:YidC/Oxa1 family membrane protein insertase